MVEQHTWIQRLNRNIIAWVDKRLQHNECVNHREVVSRGLSNMRRVEGTKRSALFVTLCSLFKNEAERAR